MEIQIQKADLTDLDLLMQWRMEVLDVVFPRSDYVHPENLEEENRAYYEQALSDGSHIACFAEADGEIVGCGGLCLHREMPSPDNPNGQCGYLMNIYCRPAYRGNGIGDAVVRWLVGQARAQGITKIYLETSEAGRPLYGKLGFTDLPDMMILPERIGGIFA